MAEQDPLLRNNNNKRFSRFRYNFQQIKSKGAILVLVWDVLVSFSTGLMYHSAVSFLYTTPGNSIILKLFQNLFFVSYILYPLGGLIADVWIGRYKVIIVSVYICFLAWIIACVGYLIWNEPHDILCINHIVLHRHVWIQVSYNTIQY